MPRRLLVSLKTCLWAVLLLCVGNAIGSRTLDPLDQAIGQSQNLSEPAEGRCFFLRARWMDPQTGRFVSEDPFGGDEERPTSLHRFLYANQSPVNVVDHSGRDGLAEFGVAEGGSSIIDGFMTQLGRSIFSITGKQALKLVAAAGIGVVANIAMHSIDLSTVEGRAYAIAIDKLDVLSKREPMVTIYRGVCSSGTPDSPRMYAEALMGMAIPKGGNASPSEHNGGNNWSNFTSWTFSRKWAVKFATNKGTNPVGVVLVDVVDTRTLVPSPDEHLEQEVLRAGPVIGATPTDPITGMIL